MADQYCLFLIPLRLIDEKLPELFYVLTDFVEIRDRLLSGDVSISDDESVLISIPAYKCCQCIDSFKYKATRESFIDSIFQTNRKPDVFVLFRMLKYSISAPLVLSMLSEIYQFNMVIN